jgi:hypothetical protein
MARLARNFHLKAFQEAVVWNFNVLLIFRTAGCAFSWWVQVQIASPLQPLCDVAQVQSSSCFGLPGGERYGNNPEVSVPQYSHYIESATFLTLRKLNERRYEDSSAATTLTLVFFYGRRAPVVPQIVLKDRLTADDTS